MPKKNNDDAFGRAMIETHLGHGAPILIERDDGLVQGESGEHQYFEGYRGWDKAEKSALESVHGRILDIGCGAGRHALHYQKKGFQVTGMDPSPLALKTCRLRGLRRLKRLGLEKVQELQPARFQTFLMMGANFGLFSSRQKAALYLRRLHRLSTPDGLIIACTLDPHKTDNPLHKAYHRRNVRRGRMPGQVKIRVRYRDLIGPWFDYLFVSVKELKGLLKGTGWQVRKLYPSKETPLYWMVLAKA